MTNILSDWAREFLREDRVAVVSTLNRDGSPQVTTIWYLLQEDGTLIMSTPGRTQKVKNLRRDPRIAVCVGDERRSVSLYGTVTISSDQNVIRNEELTVHLLSHDALRRAWRKKKMSSSLWTVTVKSSASNRFSMICRS